MMPFSFHSKNRRRFAEFLFLAGAIMAFGRLAPAQDEPFVIHETRAVILEGPYLSSLSETEATVVWITDTPCHAKVVYESDSEKRREADNAVHGLLPIGTRHVVHLRGLEPGRTYRYRTVSTRVVRMKAYWPEKGLPLESPEQTFTTFDRTMPSVSFAAVADTHENEARVRDLLELANRYGTDFLVHLGDAFRGLESETQLFSRWLGPAVRQAGGEKPLFFIRGNHEMRGTFARELYEYIPNPEGRFYYARDHGPLHLIVLDTGEDKPDATNVYAHLNRVVPYREEEFEWLENHLRTDPRVSEAPFRVVLMHQPHWGWTDDRSSEWTDLANEGRVDLVIGGHFHRPAWIEPGSQGNAYPVLVVGQDQLARIEATEREIHITVLGRDGAVAAEHWVTRKEESAFGGERDLERPVESGYLRRLPNPLDWP